MELGKEQSIPVITAPFNEIEHDLVRKGTCIVVHLDSDSWIFSTLVRGQVSGNEVYVRLIPRALPGYDRKVLRARANAAKRIQALGACRDEAPSA